MISDSHESLIMLRPISSCGGVGGTRTDLLTHLCRSIIRAIASPRARPPYLHTSTLIYLHTSMPLQFCRSIIRALASDDRLSVSAFDAGVTPDPGLPTVTYLQGDPGNKEHVGAALKGCSCCILMSTAARLGSGGREGDGGVEQQQQVVSLRNAQLLVEACLMQDVRCLVYSSAGTRGRLVWGVGAGRGLHVRRPPAFPTP